MDICLHPEFLDRLTRIPWFSRVFEPDEISTSLNYAYVKSWDEARPLFSSLEWMETIDEAYNALSDHIATEPSELYPIKWNEINEDEVEPWVEAHVEPFINETMKRYNLDTKFFYNAQADIIGIILEDVYRDTNPPSLFFAELLKFYEAGHFPCGWKDGEWPKGTLMVV